MEIPNNPSKRCWTCDIPVDDPWYIFCSVDCQAYWVRVEENGMNEYDIKDTELYKEWLIGKTEAIETMTGEEVQKRIEEIIRIQICCRQEFALLSTRLDKVTGRKTIPTHLKQQRDGLITDPNIKVSWDGDPRKKITEKKPKRDLAKELLDIDVKDMIKEMKSQGKLQTPVDKKEKPIKTDDAMAILLAPAKPKEEKPKQTKEEIDAKLAAMKEKIRLAKEKKESGNG